MITAVKRPLDMIDNEYIGKWMKWSDIVRLFPNRWVYLTNYEMDKRKNIIGGILKVVCKEPELSLVEDILSDDDDIGVLDRTTEPPGNILWVD